MRQALVAAGGKGMRLGELARRYGCKSLVPILGTPVIFYTIRWLQDAGIDEIIITVNYVIQYKTMCNLFRDNPAIRVWKRAFTAYPEPLGGVLAEHPSEFHYPEDFERVRKFLEMKINQIGI